MNNWKNIKFLDALKNSLNGVKHVYKNERNIKIQSVVAILVIILSFLLKISLTEFEIIILSIFTVLISEFFNTAIEKTVDMISMEYNEKAKNTKDIAAAAVTFAATMSIIIGVIIFLPKILLLIK